VDVDDAYLRDVSYKLKMKNQNLYIEIPNKEVYQRSYFLRKEYKELVFEVHQSGPSIYAEFIVELFPIDNNAISIDLVEAAGKEYNYLSSTYSNGIISGVTKFKSQLNNQDIGISGINIRITNLSYHAVDSKPAAYTYPFIALLNRLINTELFGMQINNNSENSVVHTSKIVEHESQLGNIHLKEIHLHLVSPKCYTNTLQLNKRIEVRIKDIEKGLDRWRITLLPKSEHDRRLYTIDCEIRDKFESERKYKTTSYSTEVYKQIEHVLKEFQQRKINIAGLKIIIEPLYNSEQEPFVKSNFEQFKWALFDSLLNKNHTISKKENL